MLSHREASGAEDFHEFWYWKLMKVVHFEHTISASHAISECPVAKWLQLLYRLVFGWQLGNCSWWHVTMAYHDEFETMACHLIPSSGGKRCRCLVNESLADLRDHMNFQNWRRKRGKRMQKDAKGCKRDMLLSSTFKAFHVFCRFLWFLCYFLCSYRSLEQHLHTANAKKLLPTNFNRVAALPKARSIGRCQKLLFCSPQTIWMWNWWKLIERPYKNEHQLYFAWWKS